MKNFASNFKLDSGKATSFTLEFKRTGLLRLVVFLIIFFSVLGLSAQNVKELGFMINSMKASTDISVQNDAIHLEGLVNDLQPTVFIQNGNTQTIGSGTSTCVDVDASSINKLSEVNPLFKGVELIRVRIDTPADLNIVINLSNLPSFTHLKYIDFLCSFNCTAQMINNLFIPNPPSGIAVSYKISIPN